MSFYRRRWEQPRTYTCNLISLWLSFRVYTLSRLRAEEYDGLSSPYHVAATYPCAQPGSSSFASHWRFLPRRLDGTTAGCSFILPPCVCHPAVKRCSHTRRFGTLASPPPPVRDMPWGPHPPGHLCKTALMSFTKFQFLLP